MEPGLARRRGWLLLLMLALVLRGVTPLGWMPNPQGPSGSPFVICTASGPQLIAAERSEHPSKTPSGEHHSVCAFAGTAFGPALDGRPDLGSGLAAVAPRAQLPPTAPRVGARRHSDHPPRAPPTIV